MKLILVVEDDADLGSLIVEALSQATPHRVACVRDGAEAINFTCHVKPNLLIIDYRLPDMNGIDLYDRLHTSEDLQPIPALVLSASMEKLHEAIRQRSLVGMSKPFDLDELIAVIEHTLHSSSFSSSDLLASDQVV